VAYFNFPPKHARLVGDQPAMPDHVSVNWMQWFQELRDGLDSGNFTPTLTAVVNITAATVQKHRFIQLGKRVYVSGAFTFNATAAAATFTAVNMTLPVGSDFTNVYDLAGSGATVDGGTAETVRVYAETAVNAARLEWLSSGVALRSMFYTYCYDIQ
jgi:hypothetical protein